MSIKKSHKIYVYHRDGGRCRYCGKELSIRQISIDHYLPRNSSGTSDIFNIVLSCKKCNVSKRDRVPNDYGDVLVQLFKRAVVDKKVSCSYKGIKYHQLAEMIQRVYKLEGINKHIVFQSPDARFYVRKNHIVKIVRISDRRANK